VTDTNVNTLVVFYSRYGAAERLALAAGVGALQVRANIRLRRLADDADARAIEGDAAWKQNLERMHRDYVLPRPADSLWADVIVLVTPADSPRQMQAYLASLQSGGSMGGKIAAPLASGSPEAALESIYAAAAAARFIVVPAPPVPDDAIDAARAHGRHVSELARALKVFTASWQSGQSERSG
jgi:hypothetical protein